MRLVQAFMSWPMRFETDFSESFDQHTQKSVPIAKGTTGPAVAKPSSTPSKAPVVPKNLSQEQGLKFVDEEGLRADIKDVRNDNSPTNWYFLRTWDG